MTTIKSSHLPILLSLMAFTLFFSCEKETTLVETPENTEISHQTNTTTKAWCNDLFAVTAAPNSEIIHMDANGYAFLGSVTLTANASSGDPIYIDDIKGIAKLFNGDYYVTTGPANYGAFSNALLRIDPFTGTVLQNVLSLGMTVSDICFVDKDFGPYFGFVGLDNNSNNLVWIPYTGQFTAPQTIPISGIAPEHTASGLTWHYPICTQDFTLNITTSSPNSNKAKFYSVDPISGAAKFVTHFIGMEFQNAHVANGWVFCTEELQVGHDDINMGGYNFSAQMFGCNKLSPWANYLGVHQNDAYEDFCSILF